MVSLLEKSTLGEELIEITMYIARNSPELSLWSLSCRQYDCLDTFHSRPDLGWAEKEVRGGKSRDVIP